MNHDRPGIVYRRDYREPEFTIPSISLDFELHDTDTIVEARLHVVRSSTTGKRTSLVLNGVNLKLESLTIAEDPGRSLHFDRNESLLVIHDVPDDFTLVIVTRINPTANRALDGLYKSGGIFCTQNEPEGFRKITFFIDRPDIMSRYTTRITADSTICPVLLSNGNMTGSGALPDGRHWTRWEDPFPKPSYLFALVAGNLECLKDRFRTMSGRKVTLRIYSDPGNRDRCRHAMRSLKRAMKWDEERFGFECDLDDYSIVAVDAFNAGAMENKGLNIFNSHYVLADDTTATDDDFEDVEAVIGHEYFHNWTGNRITCRDWFQLTLKEGLTVFRDQEFTSDLHSRAVKRIEDVRHLRAVQFNEDAGPMSHPIRPDSYMEISNFYTATVYEKGAEVIRMVHVLLGEEKFMKGMRRYVELFDGCAVTCEDFLCAMEEGSGTDLDLFRRWYSQAGTPVVSIRSSYDQNLKRLLVTVTQTIPETPGRTGTEPMHIPLSVGLVDGTGNDIPLGLEGQATSVLQISDAHHEFVFDNIPERPVLSPLRGFSAPVRIETDHSIDDLLFLFAHDRDPFMRWDAGQTIYRHCLKNIIEDIQSGREVRIPSDFIESCESIIADRGIDPRFKALLLDIPSESVICQEYLPVDFNAIHHGRNILRKTMGMALQNELVDLYHENRIRGTYSYNSHDCGSRSIAATCLSLLCETGSINALDLALEHFRKADNMTDTINALWAMNNSLSWHREHALETFYDRWKSNKLVMIKWFSLQSSSRISKTPETVRHLENDPSYDSTVPNLVRALIGGFCTNLIHFHNIDGSGYRFTADRIIAIDRYNPSLASALAGTFRLYGRVSPERRRLMTAELERIIGNDRVSRNTYEVVTRTLQSSDHD